jgi:hypothetical protein
VSVDVVDELSAALGPKWDVMREIDYVGEISIIALPADDIDAMPTLIMYEKDGQAHVATIRGVEWETNHAFSSFRHAVSAMIATAASLSLSRSPIKPLIRSRAGRTAPLGMAVFVAPGGRL